MIWRHCELQTMQTLQTWMRRTQNIWYSTAQYISFRSASLTSPHYLIWFILNLSSRQAIMLSLPWWSITISRAHGVINSSRWRCDDLSEKLYVHWCLATILIYLGYHCAVFTIIAITIITDAWVLVCHSLELDSPRSLPVWTSIPDILIYHRLISIRSISLVWMYLWTNHEYRCPYMLKGRRK